MTHRTTGLAVGTRQPSKLALAVLTLLVVSISIVGCADSSNTKPPPTQASRKPGESPKDGVTTSTKARMSDELSKSSSQRSIPLVFSSHGADIGVDFQYQNGESAWLVAMIESNGGGIAVIDFDRDGLWDLFIPGGGQLNGVKLPIMVDNGLFHQRGEFRFANVAAHANCGTGVCYSFGAAAGDWDGDGFTDLFITGYGGQQLLRNQGDGTFEDATARAGFHHRGWSSSAAWFDLENDGDLDLYVSHYGVWSPQLEKQCLNAQGEIDRCAPADFAGESDELWINEGDGTFRDESERLRSFAYRGIGVVACDWDHDGDTDLYVSNDEDPNTMFINLGQGELQESGAKSGTSLGSRNIVDGSMGLAVGDFDGNLKPDILVTNYQNEYCELYLNQGNNYFSLGTRSAGLMALGQAVVGWGTAFADVDHDADEDLIVIAGHTSRRPVKSANLQKPYLLENIQGRRLASIGESSGEFFRQVHAGRGLAVGDLDNDGDIDFAVSMLEQPVEVVTNDSDNLGNYLLIDLIGTKANRDAIGTWIEVDLQDRRAIKHAIGGGSYASTHASTLHVGLGQRERIPSILVHWPGGQVQRLENIPSNCRISVVQGVEGFSLASE